MQYLGFNNGAGCGFESFWMSNYHFVLGGEFDVFAEIGSFDRVGDLLCCTHLGPYAIISFIYGGLYAS